MRIIILDKDWTYRTSQKTIEYSPGEHEVTNEIAAQAEAEGVIPKEKASGDGKQSPTPRAKSAARARKG